MNRYTWQAIINRADNVTVGRTTVKKKKRRRRLNKNWTMQHNLVTRPDEAVFPGLIQPLLTFTDSFQA